MKFPPNAARACDPVSATVERHLRVMEADGLGVFSVDDGADGISLTFGPAEARAENYDVALIRLAGAILEVAHLRRPFTRRLRDSLDLRSHEVH